MGHDEEEGGGELPLPEFGSWRSVWCRRGATASQWAVIARSPGRSAARPSAAEVGPADRTGAFGFEFSTITGNALAGKERPTGHGTPAEVAAGLLRYREAAGVEAFQINFHGNRDLEHLLQSMECFMREVKPRLT
jgi:hypothetical protein